MDKNTKNRLRMRRWKVPMVEFLKLNVYGGLLYLRSALFNQSLVCVWEQTYTASYRYLNIRICLYSCFTCLSQETLNRPLQAIYSPKRRVYKVIFKRRSEAAYSAHVQKSLYTKYIYMRIYRGQNRFQVRL